MPKYETYSKVKEIYNVSPETVRNWAKRGQIRYKCVQNETRKTWLFDIDSIGEFLQFNTEEIKAEEDKRCKRSVRIIYARVSSVGQSSDLERQRELLSSAFPDTEIISDIGSGLNFHRPGFTSLVRKVCRDQVSQIIITFKDRLCRFGYEMFELMCKEHGCSILVYGDGIPDINPNNDPEFELKEDLLSIVNVFVASHNGKRSAVLKKERKRLAERDTKGQTLSDIPTEKEK
jgi:predicted site-specific integrase-resolvase